MQQQKRTWLSPLEIVAVILCFLYAGVFGFYITVLQNTLYSVLALGAGQKSGEVARRFPGTARG